MELPIVRKKTLQYRRAPSKDDETTFMAMAMQRKCLHIPTLVLSLLFLNIWCTFLFYNSFHFCISSRKDHDVYCITGGTGSAHVALPLHTEPHHNELFQEKQPNKETEDGHHQHQHQQIITETEEADKELTTTREFYSVETNVAQAQVDIVNVSVVDNSVQEPMKWTDPRAMEAANDYMQALRSWSSTDDRKSCDGKGFFVYDLPSKFNKDLIAQCNTLFPWVDLCEYLANEGMGTQIPRLGQHWYNTHQYSLELIFHSRILKHRCRVKDPNLAKLFYVPFYGGLDILHWNFGNVSTDVKDALGLELIQWLEAQPSWKRSSGTDHIFVLGKIAWDFRRYGNSWGSNFLSLEQMRAPYKLMIERNPWERNDIGVPHPTHFHPRNDDDILAWQLRLRATERRSLVSFAGAPRNDSSVSIRSILIEQCKSSVGYCKFFDCSDGVCWRPEPLVDLFMKSEFCLQPQGDSPTRKSVFDSLVAGCIPVLFSRFTAYYQYPWHLPEDYKKYSVFIDEEDVREGRVNVVERLKGVSVEEREEMRRYIVSELMPGLVYGTSGAKFERFRDAFDISMDNFVHKFSSSE